ncbi:MULTISPECIES: universal stress protein [unclassified Flavobacterium]|uniref:universal stress protein n=1 Tax=unclassified Flavobacterium TaxID=196869 RepID=UPI0013D1D5E3|nr:MULTISPECIES: universal stress protein [unclassified Flavobacterium]MBA5792500.1 universal stress protein [Flavobacterium sp. xlx-221]
MIQVLFPTDYSETANNAFIYALQMCKNYNGELLVLHTYAPHIESGGIPPNLSDKAMEGHTLNAFDIFKMQVNHMNALAKANNLEEVSIKFLLEEGELVQSIQEISSKETISMIIMGTTGNSGFENKILGSKTVSVIKNIVLPVLSIPHLSKFEGIDSVGFTTTYSDNDAEIINKMIPYTKYNNADIYCLHVDTGHEIKTAAEITEWKAAFKNDPVFFIDKKEKDVVKAVYSFIEEHSIDLISCITRNKSFFQDLFTSSVAEQLSYHKRVPLLTYHENMF